jgi:flagellar L-ring protein precursor FlgH
VKGITLTLALLCVPPAVRADSIWSRRTPRYGFLFSDNRARKTGDILTIVIQETSNVNQNEKRALDKATNTTGTFDFTGSTASDNVSRTGKVNFQAANTSDRNFSGSAQFTSGRTFTDRLTVTVVDVLPNGNLVIEGRRTRVVSGERRHLRITGVVRPADLSPANTVFSESVANFRIEYTGRGVDTAFSSQGYLGRLFNFLWPY